MDGQNKELPRRRNVATRSRSLHRGWTVWLQLLWLALAVSACQPAGELARPAQPEVGDQPGDPLPALTEELSSLDAVQALLSSPSSPLPEITEAEFATLQRFYAGRRHVPLWIGPAGLEPSGEALRSRLELAHSAGLSAIAPLVQAVAARDRNAVGREAAELELLFSAALVKGAIDPQNPASIVGQAEVLSKAAFTRNVVGLFRDVLPADPGVWRLRSAIQGYRDIEARGGWPLLPGGPKLEFGISDLRVELLRHRLLVTGELPRMGSEPEVFDALLENAVRHFQLRHGLLVDGIVGKDTLAALNVPVERRLSLMELNLSRLLAQRREWGEPYIVVNAAAATYRLVDGGRLLFEGVAIVGRRNWPTPQLDGLIDRLEFNPYWVVPPRIARLEVLPKIGRDPDYLRRNDMHWVGGQIRQNPGPKNPLGKVKFLFANPYDVYLHDTNSPQLFDRPDRHLSHGCVRVAGALDLAGYLLKDDTRWPPQRIEETLQGRRTVRVHLVRPIPLHIVYDTAWVDEAGIVNFREDVYGRDRYAEVVAVEASSGSQPLCANRRLGEHLTD